MSTEKAWCKEIEDMRAAIELVNTCLGTCYIPVTIEDA